MEQIVEWMREPIAYELDFDSYKLKIIYIYFTFFK